VKHVTLLVVLLSVALLAVFGAGVLRYSSAGVTLVLAATWALSVFREQPGSVRVVSRRRRTAFTGRLSIDAKIALRRCRAFAGGVTHSVPLAFGLLLLFLLLSALPVPLMLSKLAGQPRAAQNEAVADALRQARKLGLDAPGGTFFSLTRNRAGTLRLTLLAIAVFSSASLAAGLDRRDRMLCRDAFIALGAAMAVAGLVSLSIKPQGSTLWWLFQAGDHLPGPLGGFVNRNHFAGFLAMLVPPAMALAVTAFSSKHPLKGGLTAVAAALMVLTVLLSLSRGATLACAAGVLTTAALLLRHRKTHVFMTLVAITLLSALALHKLPRTEDIRSRLNTLKDPVHTQSGQTRLNAWRDSVYICATYPLIGAGPNAFRFVYPQHRRTSAREFMTHPENEYVQLATETGLVGMTLALGLILAVARLLNAGRTPAGVLEPGTAGCVAVIAVHAGLDFPLHIPLYAVGAAVLLGLAIPRKPRGGPAALPRLLPGLAVALPVIVGVLLLVDAGVGLYSADSRSRMERASPRELGRMLTWSPTAWQAWYHFGRQACLMGRPECVEFGEACIARAAECDPNNYLIWMQLGKLRLSMGNRAGARAAFARVRALREWVQVPEVPEE